MKNKVLGKKGLSYSFYLYRFCKYLSYGFPIVNFCNPVVHYEMPCIWGCLDNSVGLMVICVHVLSFAVFCLLFVLCCYTFSFMYIYLYIFLFVLPVLVEGLLPPSENSIVVGKKKQQKQKQ